MKRLGILCSFLAGAAINPAAVTFTFNYNDAAGTGFNDNTSGAARRSSLEAAANSLAAYFQHTANVVFDVTSVNQNNSTLASAGSGSTATGNGFFPSIAMQKVISNGAQDANGAAADGTINWNFFHNWDLTDSVAAGAYDYKSTAMHEVLHAFGFSSDISQTGTGQNNNTSGTPDAWSTFDTFVTDNTGARLVDVSFQFVPSKLSALTGAPGMYFDGANAKAANGGNRVALYSPNPWEDGSSGSHTDDTTFTGVNQLMMNSATGVGPGKRTLSGIELGMLADIGYTVVPEPEHYAMVMGLFAAGFAVARRNRRQAAA